MRFPIERWREGARHQQQQQQQNMAKEKRIASSNVQSHNSHTKPTRTNPKK